MRIMYVHRCLKFPIGVCSFLSLQHKAESEGGSVVGMEEVANENVVTLVDQAVVAILTRLHSECIQYHTSMQLEFEQVLHNQLMGGVSQPLFS